METTKQEFQKRKKSEKRRQAERQVREAFAQCIDGHVKFSGRSEKVKMHLVDGKYQEWTIRMEPEIEDLYSTLDVSKALAIPRERLRDWMDRKFVKPSLHSSGQGTISIFTKTDIKSVLLFSKLLERGFKREVAAEHIDMLRMSKIINVLTFILLKYSTRDGEPVIDVINIAGSPITLKIDNDGRVYNNKMNIIEKEDWEGIFVINMSNLDREIEDALLRLE